MDPLSITTGIVTLVGVGRTASKVIYKLRRLGGADETVADLLNEIGDFKGLLVVYGQAGLRHDQNHAAVASLERVLNRAKACLEELDCFIDNEILAVLPTYGPHLPGQDTPLGLKVSKKAWLVKESKLRKYGDRMREYRSLLHAAFSTVALSSIPRFQVQLEELRLTSVQLKMGQDNLKDTIATQGLATTTITQNNLALTQQLSRELIASPRMQSFDEGPVSRRSSSVGSDDTLVNVEPWVEDRMLRVKTRVRGILHLLCSPTFTNGVTTHENSAKLKVLVSSKTQLKIIRQRRESTQHVDSFLQ